ncbi:hypothetical protein LA080_010604 [Diaporthe eres]|nr:hypothetical protein LA080_010604 [Diaporthe eres]
MGRKCKSPTPREGGARGEARAQGPGAHGCTVLHSSLQDCTTSRQKGRWWFLPLWHVRPSPSADEDPSTKVPEHAPVSKAQLHKLTDCQDDENRRFPRLLLLTQPPSIGACARAIDRSLQPGSSTSAHAIFIRPIRAGLGSHDKRNRRPLTQPSRLLAWSPSEQWPPPCPILDSPAIHSPCSPGQIFTQGLRPDAVIGFIVQDNIAYIHIGSLSVTSQPSFKPECRQRSFAPEEAIDICSPSAPSLASSSNPGNSYGASLGWHECRLLLFDVMRDVQDQPCSFRGLDQASSWFNSIKGLLTMPEQVRLTYGEDPGDGVVALSFG